MDQQFLIFYNFFILLKNIYIFDLNELYNIIKKINNINKWN
jgi:hypothetical protein